MGRKKLIVVIPYEGEVTTGFLRTHLEKALRTKGREVVAFEKGTLPDPTTIRRGTIDWSGTEVRMTTAIKR